MPIKDHRSGRVRLGAFEVDLRSGELYPAGTVNGDRKTLLREQPFQVLRMLIEGGGKVVTREEIRRRLWPNDTNVDFDHSINVAIGLLRRTFSDSADHPQYIETLARRGYRLVPLVDWQESSTLTQDLLEPQVDSLSSVDGQAGEREPRAPKYSRKAVVLGASAVIFIVGYLSWRNFRALTPPKSEKVMLAVLPFENLTGDPSKEYLADGLTEETISQLGRLNTSQLGVIARTSVMGYKHKDERLDQIGRDLSVQYVLENSLRQSGDHLRITSQLLQVKDQSHLWSHDYDYRAQDILTVQDDVAKSVAREIQVGLTARQEAELARPQSVDPEAFDAYLQGHYFFERNTDKDADMAAKYYERATQLDPSYALAWVGLSRVRNWQVNVGLVPAEEGRRLSREAVERSLALNQNLPEAYVQMGRIKQQADFDWAGADASFQRAIVLEPENPEGVRLAAFSAGFLGRFDEALKLGRRAVDLDPLNADSWSELGEIEFLAGQLDEATATSKKALELKPDVWPGPIQLSQIYVQQGRPKDALPEIERVRYEPSRAFLYAIAYHALGREKESEVALRKLIEKYHTSMAFQIAQVYGFRNQSEEAFGWLDRAYAQRDAGLIGTKVDPLLKSLHKDLRFAAFLKKLNLPN
jgi:TolB-like protein/DNA-binding winged helix-turn-helix (wHTH) protein/Flp pilus assembly protein TadD